MKTSNLKPQTISWKIVFLLITFLPFFQIGNSQSLNGNHWTIDLKQIEVEDQHGWVKDRPYLVQIGYKVTLGKECSVYTEIIDGPFKGIKKLSQDVRYDIPNGVSKMQFPGIPQPPPYNISLFPLIDLLQLPNIVNYLNNNGIILYGSVIIAMRDGFLLSENEQKRLFEAVRIDIHNVLEEYLANETLFTGNLTTNNFNSVTVQVLKGFFDSTGKIISRGIKAFFGGLGENIIGSHIIININIPQNLISLLESNLLPLVKSYINNNLQNDLYLEAPINAGPVNINIDLEPLNSINNLKNFKIGHIDIDILGNFYQTLAIDGRFSVSATIGGTGSYQFYDNSLKPIKFELKREYSNDTKALYKVYGSINKATPYTPDANHIMNTECIDICGAGKVLHNEFCASAGYLDNGRHPRFMADVNGDGILDIIGFSNNRVRVSLGYGDGSFTASQIAINYFCESHGFIDNNIHPRFVKDINNDGRADVIGFGPQGVYVAYGTINGGFTGLRKITEDFTQLRASLGGWNDAWSSFYKYPRFIEDINGDGYPDIIGFTTDKVFVIFNNNNFSGSVTSTLWLNNFGTLQGWNNADSHMRLIADMNNDGKKDIVGFGDAGVYVALTNQQGNGVANMSLWTQEFGQSMGWSQNEKYPRFLEDINNDGFLDVIGFGYNDTKVALNNGGTSFNSPYVFSPEFGNTDGWGDFQSNPKFVGDLNGDGIPDLIAIGAEYAIVGISNGSTIINHRLVDIKDMKNYQTMNGIIINGQTFGYPFNLSLTQAFAPKMLVNIDNSDTKLELISFGTDGVYVQSCGQFYNTSERITNINTDDYLLRSSTFLSDATYTIKDNETPLIINSEDDYKITPNPNSGKFEIVFNRGSINFRTIIITDITGRVIFQTQSNENLILVNLDNYKGACFIYVLSGSDDKSKNVKKAIVH